MFRAVVAPASCWPFSGEWGYWCHAFRRASIASFDIRAIIETMLRDPVCGMAVDPARAAATVEHAGQAYYFCSKGCATKFGAEPSKYRRADPAIEPHVRSELVQLGAASSAVAGMTDDQKTIYALGLSIAE